MPARASAPPRKSRLLRKRFAPDDGDLNGGGGRMSNNQTAEEDLQGVDKRAICEQILARGHVQTFVDFFYLTHRPRPAQGEPPPPLVCIFQGFIS